MLKAMNTHDSVKVVADQKGTPTFAGDLAKVIIKIVNNPSVPYGTYHVTDLGETTWFEFTQEIKNQGIATGLLLPRHSELAQPTKESTYCVVNSCTTEEYPTPAKCPAYSVLCKDKIQNTLGITLPQWQESLKFFLNSKFFDKNKIE